MTDKLPICGERVKQARVVSGFDLEEFAEAIGMTPLSLIGLESHGRQPGPAIFCNICLLTGFPVRFFRQGPPPDLPMGSLLFNCTETEDAAE